MFIKNKTDKKKAKNILSQIILSEIQVSCLTMKFFVNGHGSLPS